jgi:hypothetical protein
MFDAAEDFVHEKTSVQDVVKNRDETRIAIHKYRGNKRLKLPLFTGYGMTNAQIVCVDVF